MAKKERKTIKNLFGTEEVQSELMKGNLTDFVNFLKQGKTNEKVRYVINQVNEQSDKKRIDAESEEYKKIPGVSNYNLGIDYSDTLSLISLDHKFDLDRNEYMSKKYYDLISSVIPLIHSFDKVNGKNCMLTKEDVEVIQKFIAMNLEEERVIMMVKYSKGEISKIQYDKFMKEYKTCVKKCKTLVEDWEARKEQREIAMQLLEIKNKELEEKKAAKLVRAQNRAKRIKAIKKLPQKIADKIRNLKTKMRLAREQRAKEKRDKHIEEINYKNM